MRPPDPVTVEEVTITAYSTIAILTVSCSQPVRQPTSPLKLTRASDVHLDLDPGHAGGGRGNEADAILSHHGRLLCLPVSPLVFRPIQQPQKLIAHYHGRLSSMGTCILSFLTGIGRDTSTLSYVLYWISQSSTALLFFIRIRAVYVRSKPTQYMLFALWILVSVSPVLLWIRPIYRCKSEIGAGQSTLMPWLQASNRSSIATHGGRSP